MLIKSNIQNVLTKTVCKVITNWGQGVLQVGAAFLLQIGANAYYKLGQLFYYKLGQGLLQIRAGITNWGKVYYKLGQVLQIGAKFITNWGSYYKLEQIITNWGTTVLTGLRPHDPLLLADRWSAIMLGIVSLIHCSIVQCRQKTRRSVFDKRYDIPFSLFFEYSRIRFRIMTRQRLKLLLLLDFSITGNIIKPVVFFSYKVDLNLKRSFRKEVFPP